MPETEPRHGLGHTTWHQAARAWVTRHPHEHDRRSTVATLTEAGSVVARQVLGDCWGDEVLGER